MNIKEMKMKMIFESIGGSCSKAPFSAPSHYIFHNVNFLEKLSSGTLSNGKIARSNKI